MAAISFAATNFPMENLIQVEELAFEGAEDQEARPLQRSIVHTDLEDFQEQERARRKAELDKSIQEEKSAAKDLNLQNQKSVQSKGNDFIFGIKSAIMCEEFEITKTSKHNNRQRRILVIDGNVIYHKKQCVDSRTGQPREPHNYFTMQAGQFDANASADQLVLAGAEFQNIDSPQRSGDTSRTGSGEESGKRSKVGVVRRLQGFIHVKLSGK